MLKHIALTLLVPLALVNSAAVFAAPDPARLEQVERARSEWIEQHIGPLPQTLHELRHLGSLWPGGGLYDVPAHHLGDDLRAHLTFGLTNPGLPVPALGGQADTPSADETGGGLIHDLRQRLRGLTEPDAEPVQRAGYGYELLVLTDGPAPWPQRVLEWVVNQEILGDRSFLTQVEENGGHTIKDLRIGDDDYATVLLAQAQDVLPSSVTLPNGEMQWLVATTITDDELVWAEENGMDALVQRLVESGAGQQSDLDRPSVIHPEPIDYEKISSRKEALKLYEKGLLRKVYLFPPEFGGEQDDLNAVYLPREAALEKKRIDEKVLRLARQGKITNYGAAPQYLGASFIPSAIEIRALGEAGFEELIKSWEENPVKVPSTDDIYRKLREQETDNR